MRVRIERGANSIEVDGDIAEVREILESWWSPDAAASSTEEPGDSPPANASNSNRGSGSRRPPSRRPRNTERSRPEDGFDAQAVVNQMREDPRFETFRSKIILGPASRVNCTKFVSWYLHDTPLTALNISKVLIGLGVRWDSRSISKGLAQARDDYIKDTNASPTTYRLTARGQAEFDAWMQNGE